MERLWAPWRLEYVKTADEQNRRGCIFCEAGEALILCRDTHTVTMLNKYPYNNGHLMVAPRRHTAEIETLTETECLKIQAMIAHAVKVLKELFNPEGFNIGLNIGRSAGAGIVDHLHWHVVPRWNGDTNFMPVLADVKIIPEHLSQTLSKLKPHFEKIVESE